MTDLSQKIIQNTPCPVEEQGLTPCNMQAALRIVRVCCDDLGQEASPCAEYQKFMADIKERTLGEGVTLLKSLQGQTEGKYRQQMDLLVKELGIDQLELASPGDVDLRKPV